MGVTRRTALTIQSWPDTTTIDGEGIYVTAAKAGEFWSGQLCLVKKGWVHQRLLSTQPVFETEDKAIADMKQIVEQIRNL